MSSMDKRSFLVLASTSLGFCTLYTAMAVTAGYWAYAGGIAVSTLLCAGGLTLVYKGISRGEVQGERPVQKQRNLSADRGQSSEFTDSDLFSHLEEGKNVEDLRPEDFEGDFYLRDPFDEGLQP